MKKIRGQLSLELAVLVSFALFVFVVLIMIVNANMSDKIKKRNDLQVKELVSSIQEEIVLASEASDGYNRIFEIPDKINNREYSVQVVGGLVYLNTSDRKNAIALPVPNVTGQLQKGENHIKKENGMVFINN